MLSLPSTQSDDGAIFKVEGDHLAGGRDGQDGFVVWAARVEPHRQIPHVPDGESPDGLGVGPSVHLANSVKDALHLLWVVAEEVLVLRGIVPVPT